MLEYLDNVIIPYVPKTCKNLELPNDHVALGYLMYLQLNVVTVLN